MKLIFTFFLPLIFLGCASTKTKTPQKIQLTFLDEYILSDSIHIKGTQVGGLSGIDFYKGNYYLACDDANNPRYYTAKIDIEKGLIKDISIEDVVLIQDTTHYLDLESIRYSATFNQVFMTSEGHINSQKNPSFFKTNSEGIIDNYFDIPKAFQAKSAQKPRHNGVFEGLSKSVDNKGFWLAMELPLKMDGQEPQLTATNSPVRITHINPKTGRATSQFAYKLDAVAKKPKGNFFVNGLTDILEYKKNKFLIIERSYSSGLGNQGNTVRIFDVNAAKTTNTLQINSLQNVQFTPATKRLILDFESLRAKLTNYSIDNIEGITFGPNLSNGNRTILLVSDNNFNSLGKQLNQFILLEMSFL